MNEFVVKNGLISQGDITGTGSLVVSRNITSSNISASGFVSASIFVGTLTGSLFGTSSWATNSLTASSLVAASSYTITNLTASNISASATGSFGIVGIGTTTPSQKLTVSGTGTVVGRIESTSNVGARDAQLQLYVGNSGGGDPAGSILFNASASGGEMSYGKIVVANSASAAAGNGEMQFWTSLSGTSTERMRINKDGSVGIGTTVPGALLELSSSTAASLLNIKGAGGNGLLYVSGSGNVGIGTVSPDASLSVKRNSSGYVFRAASNVSTAALMGSFERQNGTGSVTGATRFGFTSNISEIQSLTGFAFFINGTSDLNSNANGTQSLTILSTSGNVGIGTTSPAYLLDVSGSSRFGFTSTNTHQFTGSVSISGSLNATSSWSTNALTASSLVVGNSYNITNLTASNISASATGSFGIVGVGTSSPGAILEVSSSTALTVFNVKGAGGANLFTVSGSGNIGVGTTPSTSYKMQINGSFSATTKSFDIDHPVKSGKRLVYGSLESPYHGVRLTGKGKLVKGKGVIQLPDYMNALVDYDNPNVQITNIKHNKVIYVDGIDEKNNIINIAAKIPKTQLNKELEFYWTFTAVRKDVPPLQVEC